LRARASPDDRGVEGIGRTGRLVTSAALILGLAFVALSASPGTEIKIFATALVAAIQRVLHHAPAELPGGPDDAEPHRLRPVAGVGPAAPTDMPPGSPPPGSSLKGGYSSVIRPA
jgi:hypothetical protein